MQPDDGNRGDKAAFHLLLLSNYIDVCNQAIACNITKFPYHQIWQAAQDKGVPCIVHAHVAECEPIIDAYLQIDWWPAPYIAVLSNWSSDSETTIREWKIPLSYLMHVNANARHYIDSPAELDWDWMMPSQA